MQNNEIEKIYDTLLSTPGMNDEVKISLKISRKHILVLSQLIDQGTDKDAKEISGMLRLAGKDAIAAIQQINIDLLEKAGLSAMKEKLASFK